MWGWPTASQNTTYRHIISFQLYRSDDADPSVYTDLNFQGLNTEKYREKMTGYTNRISISDKADLNGDGDMNDVWTVVSGRVTVAGKWKDIF